MAHWKITISSNYASIREAASLLHEYCDQRHLSPELSGQLELILVEALNNVVKHAYLEKDGHEIHVDISDTPQSTIINITDSGVSAPNLVHDDIKAFPNEDYLPQGGWGLPLIQALADSIDYSTDKKNNLLTLTKNK